MKLQNNYRSLVLKSLFNYQVFRKSSRQYASKRKQTELEVKSDGLTGWYSRKLDSHPIITKSITSLIVTASGDSLSQYIEAKREKHKFEWDKLRTARFGFLGLVLVGPIVHIWYGSLSRLIKGVNALAVAQRVVIDQFVFAPVFVPTFMSGLWLLERKDTNELVNSLKSEAPAAIMANWVLWIPAQVINFRFVPLKYQVLFSNFVGFTWNVYLSFTLHSEQKSSVS